MGFIEGKRTQDLSSAELSLQEVFELADRLERKLKKIEAVVDDLYIKAQISHSLIVIRKVSEDKEQALKELLD